MPRGKLIDVYICIESFTDATTFEQVRKGDLVRAGHPILNRHASSFEPAENHIRFDVETATAKPGELR